MPPTAQLVRVLVFVGFVGAVYLAAFVLLIGWLREQRTDAASRHGPRFLWFRRVLFFLALSGFFCMAYGYFVEPYWLEVTRVRVESAKLPGAARPIRLVLLSDLHSDPHARLEEKLPDAVAALRPDLIFFAGDSINTQTGLPVFQKCLTRLAQIAPTFVVRGNWDTAVWPYIDLFGGTGARELDGDAVRMHVAGVELWLAGVAVGHEEMIARTLDRVPPGAFSVFLYHLPDEIPQVSARGADLYLAGHTHGGQVALPLYGALVTFSRFDKQYEAGRYHAGATTLYVNRGIGMEGGPAPRVRFCARPEVTLIELAPAR